MCAREPTQGFLTQGLRVRPVATPRRGVFRVGAIGQIGIARGGREGKKTDFLLFFCLVRIFLEDFCQTQSEIGEILMMKFWGVGGPLDFCCWKRRQPGVVASLEDFPLMVKSLSV